MLGSEEIFIRSGRYTNSGAAVISHPAGVSSAFSISGINGISEDP